MARDAWTVEALRTELCAFEKELVAHGLEPNTIRTYVDRSSLFVRWLAGDYAPRGPQGKSDYFSGSMSNK